MKRKLIFLFYVLLLIGIAGMVSLGSAQLTGVIADMSESWNYWTWEDSISNIPLDCYETYWWGIRNYIGEPIVNPVITVETDLEFVPYTEPNITGPSIYEWWYDSVPPNRWWGVGGSSEDPISVTPGFRVERYVFPEKVVSFPAIQEVNVTLWVEASIPEDANELSVVIGFYPVVWQEEILLNYNLTSWSNDAGWTEYRQGPSAIQFYTFRPFATGIFNFTAAFEVTKIPSLMGSPVSKPMVEVFWRKVSVGPAGTSTSIRVEYPNRWNATIQLEQEVNWTLVKTELPALFADMASISSPILYDSEGTPHVLDTLKFTLASGADLHVYDPAGRHVGQNYETEETESQIPGATFEWVGENQIVTVSDPMAGDYTTRLVGISSAYELSIEAISETETLYAETREGVISRGQIHECTTTLPPVGDRIDTEPIVDVTAVEEYDLTVHVVDATTSDPISGALVTAAGPDPRSDMTDSTGTVVFSNIMAGVYEVSASKTDYDLASEMVEITEDTEITLYLRPSEAPPPVGGLEAPINTLALLAPWIILALATSFGAILAAKRKTKH